MVWAGGCNTLGREGDMRARRRPPLSVAVERATGGLFHGRCRQCNSLRVCSTAPRLATASRKPYGGRRGADNILELHGGRKRESQNSE